MADCMVKYKTYMYKKIDRITVFLVSPLTKSHIISFAPENTSPTCIILHPFDQDVKQKADNTLPSRIG